MARVPTYDAPQVEARGLPGVRQSSVASPALFGAEGEKQMAMGRGLMQAGEGFNAAATRLQDRENADMLFRAETALKDDYLKFEQGVRERKGQSAWGATTDTEKFFADQEKKHSEALTNDVQRKLFGQSVTKLRQSAMGSISSYESGERRRSLEESAQASIVGSINQAAAAAAEGMLVGSGENKGEATVTTDAEGNLVASAPGVTVGNNPIAGIKSDIMKRVQVMSELNGWSPERKGLEEGKHLTNLHKQVIQALADKNPGKAREYFDANKSEINGSEHDQIGKFLKISGIKETAQTFADSIGAMSEAEAIAAARKKYSGEEEDAVVHEVKVRFAEVNQARERLQKNAADQAWQVFGRTGSMKGIPASVLADMDGRDYAALKEHAQNKALGKAAKTDFNTYYDLRQMAANDPGAFRSLDLRQYVGKLSPGDLEEMVKLQTASPKEVKDAATLSQQLSNTHDLLKWGGSDKEKKGVFDRAATNAIQAEQQRRGKELNYDERQAVIDRLVIEGDVNGMWPGGGRRFYEVQGTPDAAKFVPKIPDADKQAIVERFKARTGKVPTDAQIQQTFKTWKGL